LTKETFFRFAQADAEKGWKAKRKEKKIGEEESISLKRSRKNGHQQQQQQRRSYQEAIIAAKGCGALLLTVSGRRERAGSRAIRPMGQQQWQQVLTRG
jgi:hypothetical protein